MALATSEGPSATRGCGVIHRHSLSRLLLHLAPLLVLAGCSLPRPTAVPVPTKFFDNPEETDRLVIFLPGRGDDIDAYARGGFIDAMRESHFPADAVVVDAHLGYYIERSLGERVYEDVLQPYRARGYRRFVIVGISLGGTGALRLNHQYPELVSGIVLLAPFLGEEETLRAIDSARSLDAWRQSVEGRESLDTGEEIWTWIAALYDSDRAVLPCTVLAYGEGDRFSAAGKVLARYLPESQVFTADGGHDWTTWGRLWQRMLAARAVPPSDCARGAAGSGS